MTQTILVLLEQPKSGAILLKAAERLANILGGAKVDVLVIRRPISIPILATSEGKFTKDDISPFAAAEQHRLSSLDTVYESWARKIVTEQVLAHRFIVCKDAAKDAAGTTQERGRAASFIVAARPASGDDVEAVESFHAALFHTNRPVLIVPATLFKPFGRRVAIAWREEKHATQAVATALPLFPRAEELHVFLGVRKHQPQAALPDMLQDHEPRVTPHVIPIGERPFGETLLARLHELDIDLLVMGAYFHSPLREFIFGGVTRYMLTHADLPILMFH